nr:MAG TPA: hypothetical protein [Bacteriophage sp.]
MKIHNPMFFQNKNLSFYKLLLYTYSFPSF